MTRSPRLSIGSQATAKSRAKAFCFRTQFKSFEATATILVGPDATPYKIHKDLACAQSPFFAAALNGQFIEGQTSTITLADVEPKIFDHIILWFYTQRLEESTCFFKDGKPTYFTLLDIYALADQLCVEGLRNAVVDLMAELAEQTNSVPTPMDTNLLYENIRDSAPVRRLVLDLFAFKKTDNLVATHPDTWHPSFLRDLVCKLKRPGYAALLRHELRPWRPLAWTHTKACEVCRTVIKPNAAANMCGVCNRAFCAGCVVKGCGGGVLDWSWAERECKPWLTERGMCEYHEHAESEKCGEGEAR